VLEKRKKNLVRKADRSPPPAYRHFSMSATLGAVCVHVYAAEYTVTASRAGGGGGSRMHRLTAEGQIWPFLQGYMWPSAVRRRRQTGPWEVGLKIETVLLFFSLVGKIPWFMLRLKM
jgi:hypothetical protein